jgi:predicted DNA-binding protein (MmcQ/YjbR family)
MNRDEFNTYCATFTASTHVVQWGNSDVWKVGGKLFALCGWNNGNDAFTFKVTDIAFEVLPEIEGIRPAPYLASRGMKWLQQYGEPGLSDTELKNHITYSYNMVASKLTKKLKNQLKLDVK